MKILEKSLCESMLRAFLGVALTAPALGLPLLVLAVLGVPGVWAVVAACLVGVLLRLGFWLQRRRCPPCTTCTPCAAPRDVLDADADNDVDVSSLVRKLGSKRFDALKDTLGVTQLALAGAATKYAQSAPGSLERYQQQAALARIFAMRALVYAPLYETDPRAAEHVKRVGEFNKKVNEQEGQVRKAASVAAAKKAADAAQEARFEAQDALLSAMMATTDPMRTVKVPKQPTPKAAKCPMADAKQPLNRYQQRMLKFLAAKAEELLAHLLAKYPNDPATKNLHANWTREVLPLAQYTRSDRPGTLLMGAVGQQGAMCMVVNMMAMRPVPSSLNSLVHELSHMAHLTPSQGGHTAEFYHTHRRLMRIASDELKWTLEASCRDTCDVATDKANSRNPTGFCSTCQWADPAAQCKDFLAKIGVENVCRPMPKITSGSK